MDAETDPDAQEQLRLEWKVHKTRAENAYQCIREDTALSKSTSDTEMLTFDLEQALATPLLTTNVVFYKRQLWTYNLGIHDYKTGKGCMHMWQEGIASRGSHEIGSCLLLHLRNMQSRATKLILYSDSCGGKNRSINLVCLWMHIVAKASSTPSHRLIKNLWSVATPTSPTTMILEALRQPRDKLGRCMYRKNGTSLFVTAIGQMPFMWRKWSETTLCPLLA